MNRKRFETEIIDRTFISIRQLNATKGKDYAGDDDALANFKRAAENLGLSPTEVWGVYASKHWDAIMSFIKNGGQLESEPIEGRIDDLMVYLLLFKGLVQEQADRDKEFSELQGPISSVKFEECNVCGGPVSTLESFTGLSGVRGHKTCLT